MGIAKDYLHSFKSFEVQSPRKKSTIRKKWPPLAVGSIKTNFDGAMFDESSSTSIGVVTQNSNGEVIVALS